MQSNSEQAPEKYMTNDNSMMTSTIRNYTIFHLVLLASCYRPETGTYHIGTEPTRDLSNISTRIHGVLRHIQERREIRSDSHAAWQLLHGVLAYGTDFDLVTENEERVKALPYLLDGGHLKGWEFSLGDRLPNGRHGLRATMRPGTFVGQGHADQWLAVLAQCNLPPEQELTYRGQTFQLRDYLAQVQKDVPFNLEEEWSWSLIALTQYLETSATWIAGDDQEWSIERILHAELEKQLESSACGGTHRLIGIAMALHRHRQEGKGQGGIWLKAEQVTQQAVERAKQFQNLDGSFACNYFQRPGITADLAQVLATTGHTLEFLALTLGPEELREEWVLRAVNRLCETLEETHDLPLECGALYHAVHGLVVYQQRALSNSSSRARSTEPSRLDSARND